MSNSRRVVPRRAEYGVWGSALALALVLVATLVLLGIVVGQTMKAFWPREVLELTVQTPTGEESIVGVRMGIEPTRDSQYRVTGRVWKLFLATGDQAAPYAFVDEADIVEVETPEDIASFQFRRGGTAFGRVVALHSGASDRFSIDNPDLVEKRLAELIRQADERAGAIRRLERDILSDVDFRLNALAEERRVAMESGQPVSSINHFDDEIETLEQELADLEIRVTDLQQAQTRDRITLYLSDGSLRDMPVSDLVDAHYLNGISWFSKVFLTVRHLWLFLVSEPRSVNTEGGIFPAIFGTFIMTVLMSAAVMPLGVLTAIYLREYARPGRVVAFVRLAVGNLAGVPSIVFGVFGLGFFVYVLGGSIDTLLYGDQEGPVFGTGGIFWASLTLALMTVPLVIVATEEALDAVPRGMREASLALGATKWQTLRAVVLPASAPGMLTGLILAMARGAGEVAPLMLVGVVKLAPTLPFDGTFPFIHLERKFMHLGFHIYDLSFQSPDATATVPMAFATTFFLILLVVVLNLAAILLRQRLRKRIDSPTF